MFTIWPFDRKKLLRPALTHFTRSSLTTWGYQTLSLQFSMTTCANPAWSTEGVGSSFKDSAQAISVTKHSSLSSVHRESSSQVHINAAYLELHT